MASSAASSKRKRQYACGSIDDCGDPLDDNAMSLRALANTHNRRLFALLFTHTHFFLLFFCGACQSCDDERRERAFFCFVCVLCFVCVFLCATFSLFFVRLFDTQRYTAELLSEYPEYLRDAQVLIASLLNIPLTHLLIFHLSVALLRC